MSDEKQKGAPQRRGPGVLGEPWDDPLQFIKPGDYPELDVLLEKLRADGEDGDPFYVDYAKRRREREAKAAREAKANGVGGELGAGVTHTKDVAVPSAAAAGTAVKGGAAARTAPRPRWMAPAMVAIVAPVVAMVLGLLLTRRTAGPEAARGRAALAEAGTREVAAIAATATAIAATATIAATTTVAASSDAIAGVASPPPSGSSHPAPTRSNAQAPRASDPYEDAPSPARSADSTHAPARQEEKAPGAPTPSEYFD